jgi:hypothetical protein
MKRTTPLGALVRGLAAGAVGSAAQSLFFELTNRLQPHAPGAPFAPPDEAQRDEQATETVARRFVEGFMRRGPLDEEAKKRGGKLVHYAVGAGFGTAWALARETVPALRRPLGVAGFGVAAWIVGDDVLYPAFRLGNGPMGYPLSTHAYAITAHLVFAAATAASYEALRPRSLALAAAVLQAARLDAKLLPRLPRGTRSVARKLVSKATRVQAAHPLETVADAFATR